MNKPRRDLLIMLTALVAVMLATAAVIMRFDDSSRPPRNTVDSASRLLLEWKKQLQERVAARNFFEAEVLVRRIVKLDPENVAMRRMAGKVLYHNGDFVESAALLRALVISHPGDAVARNNYAIVLHARGEADRALRELQRAFLDSHGSDFIGVNAAEVARRSKLDVPTPIKVFIVDGEPDFTLPPLDAIVLTPPGKGNL